MCLRINTNVHTETHNYRNFRKLPKPFIAQHDLLCYKVLGFDGTSGLNFTPYVGHPVNFIHGRSLLYTQPTMRKYPFGYTKTFSSPKEVKPCARFDYSIGRGIHGYTVSDSLTFDRYMEFGPAFHVYKAAIPKGSLFYIGTAYDIVSDKMIIFETDNDYYEYVREHPDVQEWSDTPENKVIYT